MAWTVFYKGNARKQIKALPPEISNAMKFLESFLKLHGPKAKGFPHYSQITGSKNTYHCHLNKKHPRYVAVWTVTNLENMEIEVRYVGTHEGINYNRIS